MLPGFSFPPLPFPTNEQPPPQADAPAPAPASRLCGNCRKDGASLRCSVCKKTVYCTSQCQKDDWKFHKRNCEKPTTAPAPAPASGPTSSSSSTTTTTTSSSSTTKADKPLVAKPSSEVLDDDGLDEEDRAAIADVKKKGYRYFARKLDEKETNAIGDIRPKAVGAGAGSDTVGSSSSSSSSTATVTSPSSSTVTSPTPVSSSSSSSTSTASVWNKAGTTYEQRPLGDFVKLRLKELLKERRKDLVVGPLPGIGTLVVTGISGWGDSTADIIISRGKTKKIYDLSFKVVVQLQPEDAPPRPADEEMEEGDNNNNSSGSSSGDKKEDGSDSGSGSGSSSSSSSETGSTNGKQKDSETKEKEKKNPRALLYFKEISNETEADSSREVVLEWGSPAPVEAQRDVIKSALGVDPQSAAGVTKVVRGIVEQVVAEFKAK